jgi:hypothetical protein
VRFFKKMGYRRGVLKKRAIEEVSTNSLKGIMHESIGRCSNGRLQYAPLLSILYRNGENETWTISVVEKGDFY